MDGNEKDPKNNVENRDEVSKSQDQILKKRIKTDSDIEQSHLRIDLGHHEENV